MESFRLLMGGSPSKMFHLKEFSKKLEDLGIECKVVLDVDYCDGFPSRRISKWIFKKNKLSNLISEYKPDLVLVDRQRHFGLEITKTRIPLLVHLRGDFWKEVEMAKKTIYKSIPKKIVINEWEKIGEKCFQESTIILPICNYLSNVVKNRYQNKKIQTMYQGINPENWFEAKGMKLKHPCVGILQGATIWGKTKEMLILPKILESNPEITFYWVGDGPYRDKILSILNKYKNFVWLGSMNYPDKVREFLDEIDVYGLISGLDMSPLTLQEAQLMKKPILATNVGGIPELMKDKETGFLIEKGDHKEWINKISLLLNDENTRRQMGFAGRKFVEENFSWNIIAKKFVNDIKKMI